MEFVHIPVMLNECIQNLNIKPNGIYVDGTLGGGGHSSEILKKLKNGKLLCFDKDQPALDVCTERLKSFKNKTLIHDDFKNFSKHLKLLEIEKVDGFLLDLGVSSYQIDSQERGFSYTQDAPLDMRMDRGQQKDAWQVVNEYPESKLIEIFSKYGEEPFSKRIANAIVKARKDKNINTTFELVEIIDKLCQQKRGKGIKQSEFFKHCELRLMPSLINFTSA